MIDKSFFDKVFGKNQILKALNLGVILTVVSFATSVIIFRDQPTFIGIATVLNTVILSCPIFSRLLEWEERVETRRKLSFFKEHEKIIDFFIYYFIGVFVVFFILASFNLQWVFAEEHLFGGAPSISEVREGLPPPPSLPDRIQISSIFRHNLYVMVLCFALSLLYGSGALLLIILNASIFASKLVEVIKIKLPESYGFLSTFGFLGCNFGILFFHMLPEVGAYLVAAIAGGVLSKAIHKEKFLSKRFRLVIKDSVILLGIAIAILVFAAIIEIKVSKRFFNADICTNFLPLVIFATVVLILCVLIAEAVRKRRGR